MVLVLAERDYLYGRGPLRLHVERVDTATPWRYDDDDWFDVTGTQVDHTGARLGRLQVLVRASRIPPALRT